MLPIVLDAARLKIALVGTGPRAARRLELLAQGGASEVSCFAQAPDDFAGFDLVYFTDTNAAAATARAQGALVNVEDVAAQCDFHTPAIVRRGALTLTVSTQGRAAGLSAVLARYLEKLFAPAWALRLAIIEAKRRTWRAQGLGHRDIAAKIDAAIVQADWLPALTRPALTRPALTRPALTPPASARNQSQNSDTLRKTSLAVGQTM